MQWMLEPFALLPNGTAFLRDDRLLELWDEDSSEHFKEVTPDPRRKEVAERLKGVLRDYQVEAIVNAAFPAVSAVIRSGDTRSVASPPAFFSFINVCHGFGGELVAVAAALERARVPREEAEALRIVAEQRTFNPLRPGEAFAGALDAVVLFSPRATDWYHLACMATAAIDDDRVLVNTINPSFDDVASHVDARIGTLEGISMLLCFDSLDAAAWLDGHYVSCVVVDGLASQGYNPFCKASLGFAYGRAFLYVPSWIEAKGLRLQPNSIAERVREDPMLLAACALDSSAWQDVLDRWNPRCAIRALFYGNTAGVLQKEFDGMETMQEMVERIIEVTRAEGAKRIAVVGPTKLNIGVKYVPGGGNKNAVVFIKLDDCRLFSNDPIVSPPEVVIYASPKLAVTDCKQELFKARDYLNMASVRLAGKRIAQKPRMFAVVKLTSAAPEAG